MQSHGPVRLSIDKIPKIRLLLKYSSVLAKQDLRFNLLVVTTSLDIFASLLWPPNFQDILRYIEDISDTAVDIKSGISSEIDN